MPLLIGDVLPFETEVTDDDGQPQNPGQMVLTVIRPDGTQPPGSPFTVDPTTTGQFSQGVTADQLGRWIGSWLATGDYAGAHTQIIDVENPLLPAWAPTLEDVAVHIPTRTRELRAAPPDLDEYAGTFTPDTTPTDSEATALILRACDWVAGRVGTPLADAAVPLCKLAAALLAAAWIERAYPERDADLNTYQQFRDDAAALMKQARDTNVDAGGAGDTPDDDLPVQVAYSFPAAPGWADKTIF